MVRNGYLSDKGFRYGKIRKATKREIKTIRW
jgi:hypothetical protein